MPPTETAILPPRHWPRSWPSPTGKPVVPVMPITRLRTQPGSWGTNSGKLVLILIVSPKAKTGCKRSYPRQKHPWLPLKKRRLITMPHKRKKQLSGKLTPRSRVISTLLPAIFKAVLWPSSPLQRLLWNVWMPP